MRKNGLEPKKIQFVYPKINKEAILIMIEATKNGKPGLKILDPLIVHEQNGNYSKEVLKMFGSD